MPRRSTFLLPALLIAVAIAAPQASAAPAAFFPADNIDGPSATALHVSDVDIARDGTGAVAYTKLDGGVQHAFVSRLVRGVWQPPERLDPGFAAPAGEPVVAASDGGRLVVAFVADGQLFYVVRPGNANAWPAPVLIPGPGATPSVDMSINGVAYVVWSSAGDIRAARLDRKATTFVGLAAPLDINPAASAGVGAERPRVAVAADGVATAVWGEGGHVYARRMFETRPSTAPQQVDVTALNGVAGAGGDAPDIDTEDDSSYAWVVYRQALAGGAVRAVARRLRGSLFDDPVDVGPTTESAASPRIDLNGRGQGFAGIEGAATRAAFGNLLINDAFVGSLTLGGPVGVDSQPQPAVAEGGGSVVAWMEGNSAADAIVRGRAFDKAKVLGDGILSNPAFGPVDPAGGFDAAVNRAGDTVIVFVQAQGDQRRLVSATYDRAPGAFAGTSTTRWRTSSKLSWGASFELWGPPAYTVFLDGQQVAQTTGISYTPTVPFADGVHRWTVVATDRRGQKTTTKSRLLRIDSVAPDVELLASKGRKAGKAITFRRTIDDGSGSGVGTAVYSFGDGSRTVTTPTIKHAFKPGKYTVTLTVTDRAGNVTIETKRITIKA
ncbi:MAG TPA: PKD domain-containing protein [Solirubrobacteraceae bacterium]|nr:PKD domain-containing protein [Solirubrobacteraceae bacterium]